MHGPYILALDQSTSASKVYVVDAQGHIVASESRKHAQFYPSDGYAEHDANEIWLNVDAMIRCLSAAYPVCALAITNQRETTILWDRASGEPLCHAVVWQDVRGAALCHALEPHADLIRQKTGLALSPYYSAAKAAHVLRAHPEWDTANVLIGTVDSYLIYRLTGGAVFASDRTNASRTQLFDITNGVWDDELLSLFGIPRASLGEVLPSDAVFGMSIYGFPIVGVMGDSHAALYAQECFEPGTAKATYGTGSSVMMNIGGAPVLSASGLSTSIGYALGENNAYVLEGNVTSSGDTLVWLIEQMGLFTTTDELEHLASTVPDSGGVVLIPAFSGLGAPHFNSDARALLCGMSRATTRAHIARAALESIALQDYDVIHAMGTPLKLLRVDGGPTRNALLMQFQADILGCDVQCAKSPELSALGVAFMALRTLGINKNPRYQAGHLYTPQMDEATRSAKLGSYYAALHKALRE